MIVWGRAAPSLASSPCRGQPPWGLGLPRLPPCGDRGQGRLRTCLTDSADGSTVCGLGDGGKVRTRGGENRVKRNPRSRTTLQTDEHRDRAGSGMCHLRPIIHLQYEDCVAASPLQDTGRKAGLPLGTSASDPGKGGPARPVPGERPRQRSAAGRGKREAGLHRKLNLVGRFPRSVPMQSPLRSNLNRERLVHLQPHVLNAAQDLLLVPC